MSFAGTEANAFPNFGSARILCVGDLMLDRFVSGAVDRISPESPVPIVRFRDERCMAGGAANVAQNIAALGGHCTLIGIIGRDPAGEELKRLLGAEAGVAFLPLHDANRPTTEKTRFVAHGQHMLRVDREDAGAPDADVLAALERQLEEAIAGQDVLILSDYAKGLLTDPIVAKALAVAKAARIPVVVDPKSAQLGRYRGAAVVTPNVAEAALASAIRAADDQTAEAAARAIADRFGLEAVLLTRAEQGMTLYQAGGEATHIRATARDVFDVVGAGDTVVAVLAICLAAGASLEIAARTANLAGGLVVAKHGIATVSRGELMDEMARAWDPGLTSAAKVLARDDAGKRVRDWRAAGLSVGFTNGCFDILHAGHARLLQFARGRCDRLVVGLNADASVKRLKGEQRPINPLADRAEVLAALASVDAIVSFEEDTPLALIQTLKPDLLVKGADYRIDQIIGADFTLANGGRVETFELMAGRSTTALADRLATTRPDAG
jgi:D-beta-D-heptose 7-phosphate kinase/D-beta-D-heptose 1-phosphate adenosyltransferase